MLSSTSTATGRLRASRCSMLPSGSLGRGRLIHGSGLLSRSRDAVNSSTDTASRCTVRRGKGSSFGMGGYGGVRKSTAVTFIG